MNVTARPIHIAIIILYLPGTAGVGVWFASRNKTTEEYFVGCRSIPPGYDSEKRSA